MLSTRQPELHEEWHRTSCCRCCLARASSRFVMFWLSHLAQLGMRSRGAKRGGTSCPRFSSATTRWADGLANPAGSARRSSTIGNAESPSGCGVIYIDPDGSAGERLRMVMLSATAFCRGGAAHHLAVARRRGDGGAAWRATNSAWSSGVAVTLRHCSSRASGRNLLTLSAVIEDRSCCN